MSVRVALLAALSIALGGCCTDQVGRSIDSYRCYAKEFREFEPAGRQGPYPGAYLGILERGEVRYARYRFPDVLHGDEQRALEVLVPHRDAGTARAHIAESADSTPSVAPAILTVHWNDAELPDSTPAELAGRLHGTARPYHSLHLDLSERAYRPAFVYCCSPELLVPPEPWRRCRAEVDLRWEARSQLVDDLQHLRYAYAVPLDVVTYPLQLVAFVIIGL